MKRGFSHQSYKKEFFLIRVNWFSIVEVKGQGQLSVHTPAWKKKTRTVFRISFPHISRVFVFNRPSDTCDTVYIHENFQRLSLLLRSSDKKQTLSNASIVEKRVILRNAGSNDQVIS